MSPDPTHSSARNPDSERSLLGKTDWKQTPSSELNKDSSSTDHLNRGDKEEAGKQARVQEKSEAPQAVKIERRQTLEHHLRASPTDLDAYLELAHIYRNENRPADARRILKQAREVFPEDESVLWEYEEAVLARSLQQLREVAEISQRLNTNEIDRELQRSENDWACRRIEVCQSRLARNPMLDDLRLSLGEAMHDAGRYEDAIHELSCVLEKDQHSPHAYLLQGRCYLQLGKTIEAMSALRAVALRRAVVAPAKIRVLALQLLISHAHRTGVTQTLALYQEQLARAEKESLENENPA